MVFKYPDNINIWLWMDVDVWQVFPDLLVLGMKVYTFWQPPTNTLLYTNGGLCFVLW